MTIKHDDVCYCAECNTSIDCESLAKHSKTYDDYVEAVKFARKNSQWKSRKTDTGNYTPSQLRGILADIIHQTEEAMKKEGESSMSASDRMKCLAVLDAYSTMV